MSSVLSPGQVLLLAAHYATHGDIESLARLASRRSKVLHKQLLLRILLTYLPEIVKPSTYAGFLLALARDNLGGYAEGGLDTSAVEDLSEDEVTKQAGKLHLQQLVSAEIPSDFHDDPLSSFLILRSYNMDSEAGLISQVPSLLSPFLSQSPALSLWATSTVVPYVRRNVEYYADENPAYSLLEFQNLSDSAAVLYLLSRTGSREEDKGFIGRDIRGLLGPWLHGTGRWASKPASDIQSAADDVESSHRSAGWKQFLEWLVNQAATSWTVAVAVAEQWGGPKDIDLGEVADLEFTEAQQQYLLQSYARAVLASAYLISEATAEALSGAYRMVYKMRMLLGYSEISPTLEMAVSQLPSLSNFDVASHIGMKSATYMRNDLLLEQNLLTSPTEGAMALLTALILSASICTSLGAPCSVRKAGDLAFIQDQREQKGEIAKLIRSASAQAHGDEDKYWSQVRAKLLWLNTWGTDGNRSTNFEIRGMLGAVPKEFVETEILKAFLSSSRYTLAKSIYEDSSEQPLAPEVTQDTVYQAALRAFDNASNPNRSRGGLKKCDEIIHSFPKTLNKTHPATKRVEALLRCTHALSEYRLTLKQGEPFKPVVLRVHSDPISIIEKVLEQNPKAYTRLPEFLEMAANMVRAGITQQARSVKFDSPAEDNSKELTRAEKLIVALCIEAALREDDFETAYSYVVSRLETPASGRGGGSQEQDEWSWKAALKAGQYIRTDRTLLPTHLGIASGNPEIRHLEQRIECLATALRVAPTSQLLEILKTFRRCEEQLDSAIAEEAAAEASWAAAGEVPGAFDTTPPHGLQSSRNMTATAASKQAEEAPMSLFDLSRATASVASRNFTKLSSLSSSLAGAASLAPSATSSTSGEQAPQRLRKRDQLREAATGTLVSGVGWLIGANVNREATET
ncbi:Protein transport protein sec39 [Trichoderma ghanense]|uniref:Protein transport protein sec39 n=1 Tax=Trichoderma ghanense TaxID=65468 RepID=A0ABY2GWJ6_9HYPO